MKNDPRDAQLPMSTPGPRPSAPPPPRTPEWMRARQRAEPTAVAARVLPPPMPHGKRSRLKRGDSAILIETVDVVAVASLEDPPEGA